MPPSTLEQLDKGYRCTLQQAPKVSIAHKQEMVIGGTVPSWTNSIPGPKYQYDLNTVKEKSPVFTMRVKPEMVIGGSVPSWTNSIPGPKYSYDANLIKERQPVYSIAGGGDRAKAMPKKQADPNPNDDYAKRIEAGFNFTNKGNPSFSIGSRQENVIGGDVVSWKRSIPGPYSFDIGSIRAKQPVFTIGEKLPTESDMMKSRSPGPMRYSGAATNMKQAELVDSTKKRSFSCSFGIGPRWDGPTQDLLLSGAWSRYDKLPKGARDSRPRSAPAPSDPSRKSNASGKTKTSTAAAK